MLVFVLNKHGNPLMPCSPNKARRLLKEGKAKVVRRTPFTIKLVYGSSGYRQKVTLGVDSGFTHIGISAITECRELYSAEVLLRTDMVKLNSERAMYRRSRRGRKTRYRPARFDNRKKPSGWLAPSVQHKLDSHVRIIGQVKTYLPISEVVVEVAAFDIQKIKNPDVEGKEYQQGEQLDFWNTREYVLHRDNHQCQACKGKSKDKILNVHHLESRQTGGDRPDNLITLCETCHHKYHTGTLTLAIRKVRGFRAETFMSTVRWKMVNTLRELGDAIRYTYGYVTKNNRITYGIEKSHRSDAFVIAGGTLQKRSDCFYLIKQVRKNNRKLFKGVRSHIKNTAPRFVHGFQRFDKVLWKSIECFIFARRLTGYFDIRKLDGTKVHSSVRCKELGLLEKARTLLIERHFPLQLSLETIGGVSSGGKR